MSASGAHGAQEIERREPHRGRSAEKPSDIPAKGWWDVAMRVKQQVQEDNASLVAAGLAHFALLAVFPSLAAAVAIYGLFASPAQITEQMNALSGVLPPDGAKIIHDQLQQLSSQETALGIGAVVGIMLALWSARKGMVALLAAINVAYDEEERRSSFRQILVTMGFTVGAVVGFLIFVALAMTVPLFVEILPLGPLTEIVLLVARWVLLWFVATLGLSLVYRFAPSRDKPKWRWVSWGSGIAATLWLLASVAFALYLRFSDSYSEAYGALAGVVITLIWFYMSSFCVILGAEINAELERQTAKDTTEGQPKRMGERHAYAADTLGPPAGAH